MGGLFCLLNFATRNHKDCRRFAPASPGGGLKQAWRFLKTKKPRFIVVFGMLGGERGIRTPGPVTVNGFQDRRIRPLCHLSAANVGYETELYKK
jgi:hypothetical protein